MAKSKKVLTKKNKTMRKKMRWGGAVNNMKAAPVAVASAVNNMKTAPVAVESEVKTKAVNNKKPAVNNKKAAPASSVMSFFNKLNPLKK